MHSHDTRESQQYLRIGWWWQRHQQVSGNVPLHIGQFLLILRDVGWLKEQYSLGYGKLPKYQLPPMTYCDVTKRRRRNNKHIHQHVQWGLSSAIMQEAARHSQEKVRYDLQVSCATSANKRDTIRETAHLQHLTIAWGHNYCRWDSPWHNWQTIRHQLTSSI